ncbi:gp05 [Xylella phage Xfas53]|uniref:gp05 n=1 Tax=Xylella phage Xfas53 TaxID=670252 RepID=UPI0001B60EDC|nr:gp05 [Xylella phage Xfas53]ACV41105.1 gp05 [Xylella phage Xfas53]
MTQKNALMISAATPATSTPSIHLSRSISPLTSVNPLSIFDSSFNSSSRKSCFVARSCKFVSSTSAKASASASACAAGTPAVFSRFANLSVSNATDVTQSPALAPCGGEYSSVPPTHPEVLHGALA